MPKRTNPASSPPDRPTKSNHPPPCHNFVNTGKCPFGDRCRYSHANTSANIQASSSSNPPEKRPCYTFLNTGNCPYGDRCRFSHEPKLAAQPSSSSEQTAKRPCYTFLNTGACPYGDHCHFSHGPKLAAQPSSSSEQTVKRPCYTFLNTGACPYGDRCHYSHIAKLSSKPSSSSQPNPKNPCFTFVNTGTCPYGQKCRYAHTENPEPPQISPSTTSDPQAFQDVIDFTKQLSRNIRSPNFTLPFDDPSTRTLWQNAWAAVAVGANLTSASTLLRAYMRLPATTALAPQTNHLLATLSTIADHSTQNDSTPKTIIKTLQHVASAIEHRLILSHTSVPEHLRPDCTAGVQRLTNSARTALLKAIPDPEYSETASGLLYHFLDLLKRYSSLLDTRRTSDDTQEQQTHRPPWAGWQEATVGWLQRGAWLDAPQLQSSYEDVASYTESLRQMVTMLTFYWGAGAIFPKCRQHGHDDRPCDQPLCTACKGERRPPCSRKLPGGNICSAPAKWRCWRKGHDAVCGRCLRELQTAIVGKPGPRASTDIYDAVVERETVRREGIVYILSQLRSRKPPKINPNWKTTYRLKCSALVGVVRLGASCEPLIPQQRLELAEIVPVNSSAGIATDFQERRQGRLALRLLTKGDLSMLTSHIQATELGSRVALIDMQVFVPEVLSVLSTISDAEFVDHLNAIPFSNAMICKNAPRLVAAKDLDIEKAVANSRSNTEIHLIRRLSNFRSSLSANLANLVRSVKDPDVEEANLANLVRSAKDPDIEEAVANALSNTEISLIRRLSPKLRSSLSANLANLVRSAKLDGTQLKAFLAAIQYSLHCTQGPPGTGKSYLGVTLIRALVIVRDNLIKSGIPVGPIVVLSYKNHALDEILLDVVKSDAKQLWSCGGLIRCGKSDNEPLNEYRERNSPAEIAAERLLAARVACMRSVQCMLRDWRSLQVALLMSVDKHDGEHPLRDWTPSRHEAKTNELVTPWKFILHAVHAQTVIEELRKDPSSELAYSSIESLSRKWDLLKRGVVPSTYSTFDGLDAGTEHWVHNGPHRILFLLENWLLGASPPPRCLANEEEGGCLLQSPATGAYCLELHACRYDCGCDRRREERKDYCNAHVCVFTDHSIRECPGQRMPRSDVCKRHACPHCITYEGSRIRPKEPGSRSPFCKEHKCVIPECIRHRLREKGFSQDLCTTHACIACDGKRNQVSENCLHSCLCDLHRCTHVLGKATPCASPRGKNSHFCEVHTCHVCCRKGLPLTRTVVDRPPRNVCLIHPLCAFVSPNGNQCNQATGHKDEQYCQDHVNGESRNPLVPEEDMLRMQCHGITRKGKRCKSTGLAPKWAKHYYCPPHFSQNPDASSPESEDDVVDDESLIDVTPSVATEKVQSISLSCSAGAVTDAKADENFSDRHQNVFGKENGAGPVDFVAAISPDYEHNRSQAKCIQTSTHVGCNRADPGLKNKSGDSHATITSSTDRIMFLDSNSKYETEHNVDPDDYSKGLMYGTNPDECEMEFSDELSDGEVPDHIQHLHDINDNDSVSDFESEDDSVSQMQHDEGAACSNAYSNNLKEWAWDQAVSERCHRAAEFLRYICNAVTRLVTVAEFHVERTRRERSEAAGFVFKNARVVGATVVGATRRLQAIRASEPFAMLVEEACEVLEPTLVSVIAVRSLCKLELIGDHRQLPAFVQPCWFSIQTTHPTIKVSLFERLVNISGQDKGISICSALDVQRRMRPEICDLTRCEYDDVVNIIDDPCTISRRIGDAQNTRTLGLERELWCTQGRIVPGMQSTVFFWNLKTKEGRAAVGLSRCNIEEARACVDLIGWLLYCGVPPASISVITPYKGQKQTIVNELRRVEGALPEREKSRVGGNTTGVFVSTIDRYQGDENDIVLLSLVCTKPGNRFVALRNRFIVAASRARLGFYIVGSTDALAKNVRGGDGPSHWRRLLRDLAQPEDHRTDERNELDITKGDRVAGSLSVCCPRHPETALNISDHKRFPHLSQEALNAFCSKQCPFILPWCGHRCSVPCHSPRRVLHTSKCDEKVQRPCDSHENVPLRCHEVAEVSKPASSLTMALSMYKCEVMKDWKRSDCSHIMSICCHEFKKLREGGFQPPLCKENVIDYVNPLCGHIIATPECHSRRKWEDKPPQCKEVVIHKRTCGCSTRMSCYQRVHEASLDIPPRCLEAVSRPRPRCSHLWSSRCHEATTLRELWLEERGESITSKPPLVVQGTFYGPSETDLSQEHPDRLVREIPPCRIPTEYRSSCGHILTVPCSEAFELALGAKKESLCTDEGSFASPICGHQIRAPCYFRSLVSRAHLPLWTSNDTSERMVDERELRNATGLDQRLKKIRNSCSGSVSAARACAHVTEGIPCAKLFSIINSKKLPLCKAPVGIKRPCGHVFKTVCGRETDPLPVCNEAVDEVFTYPCGRSGHEARPNTCYELTKLRTDMHPRCPIEVRCVRVRCKHEANVPCYLVKNVTLASHGHRLCENGSSVVESGVEYCGAPPNVVECLEPVVYRRLCGHEEMDISCHLAFEWASSEKDAPPCIHEVEAPSPLCGHLLRVPCQHEHHLKSINLWGDLSCERITISFEGESVTIPVVEESQHVPLRPPLHVMPMLRCGLRTRLVRSCGHEEEIECEKFFERLDSDCEHLELKTCGECGYEEEVTCSKLKEPFLCQNVVEKLCSLCRKNIAQVECFKQAANCKREVKSDLPCGHMVSWICGEDDPVTEFDVRKCLRCLNKQWTDALCEARGLVAAQDLTSNEDRENDAKVKAGAFNSSVASLLQLIRDQVANILPSSCIVSRNDLRVCRIKNLLSAYVDILSCNIDVISAAAENGSDDSLEFSSPPGILDARQSFDIVYCVLARKDNPEDSFTSTETRYGRGTRASILSMKALEVDCNEQSRDGSLSICVAGALKYRLLEDTPAFRTREGSEKWGAKKSIKAEIKARKLMQGYKHAGFDHVVDADGTNGFTRVYWIPGAIVPVLKLDVQLFQTCEICLDDMLPSKGWLCPADHFVCRGCFSRMVKLASEPDGNNARTVDRNGWLLCPHDGCGAKYEEVMLLGQAHDADVDEMKTLFQELQRLKIAVHAKHEVDTALEGQKAQLQADFQRIMEIRDLDERQAETVRLKIVDQVLTLCCPACKKAFIDFDGCFALKCSTCKVNFCAWCLKHHTKGDVHRHVATCRERCGAGVFHNQNLFHAHHRRRRRMRVIETLKRENGDVRKRVLERLADDLCDLGIAIDESDLRGTREWHRYT